MSIAATEEKKQSVLSDGDKVTLIKEGIKLGSSVFAGIGAGAAGSVGCRLLLSAIPSGNPLDTLRRVCGVVFIQAGSLIAGSMMNKKVHRVIDLIFEVDWTGKGEDLKPTAQEARETAKEVIAEYINS